MFDITPSSRFLLLEELVGSMFSFLQIIFSVFLSLPFHLTQFFSNLFKYSFSNFLSSHLYNNFTVYLPSNSVLLKSFSSANSSLSCFLTSTFLSNSSTNFFIFFRFSSLSQLSFSAVNPFYLTRYFTTPLSFFLFNIFSTLHSLTSSTSIGFTFSFFCSPTCPLYCTTQLTFITGCILIDVSSHN